jgi:nucleoside-diphosphate-sugar epimerase
MRVLITGGAGYLGSTMVALFLRLGWQVTIIDDFRYGQHLVFAAYSHDPNLEIVVGDARDRRVMEPLVSRADVILPLAALVGAPLCERRRIEAEEINYRGPKLVAGLASPGQLIIYPNTNSGYGVTGADAATEDTNLNPISWYGRTKCSAERSIMKRPNSITLRLATVYGLSPRMRLDLLVNDFVFRASRDRTLVLYQGHFRRSVVHVRDVARAFAHAIERSTTLAGSVYNVASENLTKRRLAELIQRHVPELQVIDDGLGEDPDQRDYEVSSERLLSTGFRFSHDLDAGIAELVRGLRPLPQHLYGNV